MPTDGEAILYSAGFMTLCYYCASENVDDSSATEFYPMSTSFMDSVRRSGKTRIFSALLLIRKKNFFLEDKSTQETVTLWCHCND